MTNTAKTPPNSSVTASKEALRRNSANKAERAAREARSTANILQLVGGNDLASLAVIDPEKAKKISIEVACLQADLAVDQLISQGLDRQIAELAPSIVNDTARLIKLIQAAAAANIATVTTNVLGHLKKLGLYEDERLYRLAHEAIPVRAERGFHAQFDSMRCGNFRVASDGKGGDYMEDIHGMSVVACHDAAEAAWQLVQARTAEIRKRYGA